MSRPVHISEVLPAVIAHLWGDTRFEYGSSVNRCPCGLIRRVTDKGEYEYWRWEGRQLVRLKMPPPHQTAA